MRASVVVVVWIVLGVAGCGSAGNETNGAELKGVARIGQEDWSFQACGTSDRWSVSVDAIEKGAIENFDGARRLMFEQPTCSPDAGAATTPCLWQTTTTYLDLVGDISAPGMYGHLGAHGREVRFRRIISATRDVPATCSQPMK